MTWEFPIHVFLCGLFTYLFLRAWNFGFYGALIGGLAYMLGGLDRRLRRRRGTTASCS